MYFESDPFTGYRLKPNSLGYFQEEIPARANNHGHRDKFVSVEKADGVFRIMVLGDSFTMGTNVAEEEAYPEVLETLLALHATTRVEVVNAGVGGWSPFQYAQYYQHYGSKFSPDLILIGFFVGNDTYIEATAVHQLRTAVLGRRVSAEAASDRFIDLKVFLYNHSNIARLLLNKGPVLYKAKRESCSYFDDWFLALQRSNLVNHLKRTQAQEERVQPSLGQIKRIKKLAERDSIPVVVVLIPDENQINTHLQHVVLTGEERSKFDFEMPQSMLKDLFADAGIPVIDLLPFFKNDSRCLYLSETHWTAEGHDLAAAVIYEHIVDERIWPNLTSRFNASP